MEQVFGLIALVLIIYGHLHVRLIEGEYYEKSNICYRSKKFCELDTYYNGRLCEKEGRNVTVCVYLLLYLFPIVIIFFAVLKAFVNVVAWRDELKRAAS